MKSKVYQISDKSVHRELRIGVSDPTFQGKKHQPKLQIRTLVVIDFKSEDWCFVMIMRRHPVHNVKYTACMYLTSRRGEST